MLSCRPAAVHVLPWPAVPHAPPSALARLAKCASHPPLSRLTTATTTGKNGKTKFTIENATRTRIVLADTKIHILGSFQNIRAARDSICALILGSPAGKVYSKVGAGWGSRLCV